MNSRLRKIIKKSIETCARSKGIFNEWGNSDLESEIIAYWIKHEFPDPTENELIRSAHRIIRRLTAKAERYEHLQSHLAKTTGLRDSYSMLEAVISVERVAGQLTKKCFIDYLQGLTPAETAKRLGIAPTTVIRRLKHAFNILKM